MNHYTHDVIRAAGTNSMLSHLWYFSERLVASAFFDDRVSNKTKESMAKNLQRNRTTTNLARLNGKDFHCTVGLENYVTRRSMCFFDLIEANGQKKAKSFLSQSPSTWLTDKNLLHRNEINCAWAERSKRYSRKRCSSHSGIQWQPYSRRRTTTILASSSCSSSSSSSPTYQNIFDMANFIQSITCVLKLV